MKVKVFNDHETMSRAAAAAMAREIQKNPRTLLCLATGSSPSRAYELIGKRAQKSPALCRRVRIVKLDEWEGLDAGDPGSNDAYFSKHVIGPWKLPRGGVAGFTRGAKNPDAECRRVRAWLASHGPVDLCVLGLGVNGHLGFNEPASSLPPFAHRAVLAAQTQTHSMVRHAAVKPKNGFTLGLAEILQSREILLLVSGDAKRLAIQKLLRAEISTELPASLLWLHPNATILCDRAAAGDGPPPAS